MTSVPRSPFYLRRIAALCLFAFISGGCCELGLLPPEECETCTTCPPPPAAKTLALRSIPQETPIWCWAAAAEMVLKYYGRSGSQCEIVYLYLYGNYRYDLPCCLNKGLCLTGAPSLVAVQQPLTASGIGSTFVGRALTSQEVVREISANRPIVIGYSNSFAGHVVVAYGYEENGQVLLIHDPYYGTFRVAYAQTLSYGGRFLWSQSLINVR